MAMMGISSVHSSEKNRIGDGDVTDTEDMGQRNANDSTASTPIVTGLGNCPGADLIRLEGLREFSWNVLTEVLIELLALPPLLPVPLTEQLNTKNLSPTRDRFFITYMQVPNPGTDRH